MTHREIWQDSNAFAIVMQAKPTFEAAIKGAKDAGAEVVEIDMSLLESLADSLTPSMLFFTYEMPREVSRYVYQHGYNLSLAELVDKIASPTVRSSMLEWTYKKLDSFPTPIDYAKALATGDYQALCGLGSGMPLPEKGISIMCCWQAEHVTSQCRLSSAMLLACLYLELLKAAQWQSDRCVIAEQVCPS